MSEIDWAKHRASIDSLLRLEDGWDSYNAPAPNAIAAEGARMGLECAREAGAVLWCVSPSSVGGIGLVFSVPKRYADIEFFNDGEVAMIKSVRAERQEAMMVERTKEGVAAAIRDIQAFITNTGE